MEIKESSSGRISWVRSCGQEYVYLLELAPLPSYTLWLTNEGGLVYSYEYRTFVYDHVTDSLASYQNDHHVHITDMRNWTSGQKASPKCEAYAYVLVSSSPIQFHLNQVRPLLFICSTRIRWIQDSKVSRCNFLSRIVAPFENTDHLQLSVDTFPRVVKCKS